MLAAVTWDCWTCGFAFGPDKSESLCSHTGLRLLAVDLVSFGACLSESSSTSILKFSQTCLLLQPGYIQGFKHVNSTFPARYLPAGWMALGFGRIIAWGGGGFTTQEIDFRTASMQFRMKS